MLEDSDTESDTDPESESSCTGTHSSMPDLVEPDLVDMPALNFHAETETRGDALQNRPDSDSVSDGCAGGPNKLPPQCNRGVLRETILDTDDDMVSDLGISSKWPEGTAEVHHYHPCHMCNPDPSSYTQNIAWSIPSRGPAAVAGAPCPWATAAAQVQRCAPCLFFEMVAPPFDPLRLSKSRIIDDAYSRGKHALDHGHAGHAGHADRPALKRSRAFVWTDALEKELEATEHGSGLFQVD